MAAGGRLLASFLLLVSCFAQTSYGIVLFSSLQRTLVVTASHKQGVLKAGEDTITVTWGLNQSIPSGTDSGYKTIQFKLCYGPISQLDRAWRKTVDNLDKDRTCQFKMVAIANPHTSANQTFDWLIGLDVPTATYFVRAYAYDSEGISVAYGQNTDAQKTSNLIAIQGITGRHLSIYVSSMCFSAFSVLSLVGFFYLEKRRVRMSQQK
ncbi:hypothetical protein CFOL_v3_08657 [Cephalotus follicularis]|uniref:High-affinity nitrate transporter n=1 Tax=Cephalotus follicularis TaxID=3775 RepID=A0A1Q3BBF6_CEPFO|nr:hypothetical protein CFOL_v3_08657 [Cephalotus follicularis]